jgi:hypothetical protein
LLAQQDRQAVFRVVRQLPCRKPSARWARTSTTRMRYLPRGRASGNDSLTCTRSNTTTRVLEGMD